MSSRESPRPKPRRSRAPRAGRALVLALALAGCTRTLSPPQSTAAEPADLASFDETSFSRVLAAHVDERGRVDYEALREAPADLERFVRALGVVGPRTRPDLFPSRAHRLAYHLNAYNALTLYNVVRRPDLRSVYDEKVSFFWWTTFALDGDTISLYDLENDLIRPEYEEPRVHFALNCASLGCPHLPREPFEAERLEAQLARETQRFLREERNLVVDGEDVIVSSVFDWFERDFPPDPVTWLRERAPHVDIPSDARLRFRAWDWQLNEQTTAPKASPP